MPSVAFVFFAFGILSVLLQCILAQQDHFLLPQDMLRHHGVGLPLIWHLGIIVGDLLIVTPLCTLLIAWYGGQWSLRQLAVVATAALILSGVMHYQYLHDPTQNADVH